MAEETKNDLSARLGEIEGGGRGRASRSGSGLKAAALGALVASAVGGSLYVGSLLSEGGDNLEPSRQTSTVGGFAEDSAVSAAPALPRPVEREVIREVVADPEQSAALKALEARLAALDGQLVALAAEKDQAAQAALEALQAEMATDLADLKDELEASKKSAEALEDTLTAELANAKNEQAAKEQAWLLEKRNLQNQLAAAQDAFNRGGQNTGPTEEELRLQRIEAERLRRVQEAEAQYNKRVNSGLVAFKGASAAGQDSEARELSERESFVASSAKPVAVTVSTKIARPEITIVQGTIIQAALETAIDSSLPGTLRAVVSEDVHSFDGRNILIPRGSKLFGEYQSDLTIADSRILVAWNRVVTPEGRTAVISSYGADDLGRSGTTGQVYRHFMKRFGAAAAISIIGAAPTLAASRVDNANTADVLENVGNDLSSQTGSVIGDYLSMPPTIRVDQGARIAVILDRDLVLP